MKVTVVRPRELSADHQQLWTQFQKADPTLSSPYFCWGFTHLIGQVREDVRVGILEAGGRAVGFFPHQRGRFGMGRPVGGPLSDFQGIIAAPGTTWDPRGVIAGCRLAAWDFDHLLATQTPFAMHHRVRADSPYMDLQEGFEGYAAARRAAGSEQIKKNGTLRRKLEREVGPLRFEIHEANAEALTKLFEWKARQYAESGIPDVLGFPWVRALVERLVSTHSPDFAGMFSTLYVGDELIAAHLGMRSRHVWHYWFPCYGPQWAKFSPGLILLIKMAEAAPSLGLTRIDLGKGDTLYKQRMASGAVPVAEGSVELRSLGVAMRNFRARAETLVRRTPLVTLARVPGRLLKRLERRRQFQ